MIANRSTFTTSIIPPLENGDRLTRNEFERRYQAMPQIKKAELAVSALLSGEMTIVLEILQQGLNTSEHQEFIQRLSL